MALPGMLLTIEKTATARQASTSPKSPAAEQLKPLVLTGTIPLPGVQGRFDHFAADAGCLFISELGNNSVAIINTRGRTLERTITVILDPQGEAFSPEASKLFSASSAGKVDVFDSRSYELVTTINFRMVQHNLR